jgi:hypothetical protein
VRGRSYAFVLVIPRRKMRLCEALHGRAAMAGVGAPWPAMGSSSERGKRGNDEGERGAARVQMGHYEECCYGGGY